MAAREQLEDCRGRGLVPDQVDGRRRVAQRDQPPRRRPQDWATDQETNALHARVQARGVALLPVWKSEIKVQAPHAIDAMLSPQLRLLDGVEVHEGLCNSSQDNLTHWLISTQAPAP